jgi:hypothetical protein
VQCFRVFNSFYIFFTIYILLNFLTLCSYLCLNLFKYFHAFFICVLFIQFIVFLCNNSSFVSRQRLHKILLSTLLSPDTLRIWILFAQNPDQILFLYIVKCRGYAWLIIMGSGSDDWIYWCFFTVTLSYSQYSAIADLHKFKFTTEHDSQSPLVVSWQQISTQELSLQIATKFSCHFFFNYLRLPTLQYYLSSFRGSWLCAPLS